MSDTMPAWYFNTKFEIPIKPENYPARFMIITAFNPYNKALSDAQNIPRNQQLKTALMQHFDWCYAINGFDPHSGHKEPGFMVNCESLDVACNWGQNYQQDAIYFVIESDLYVVRCTKSERVLKPVCKFASAVCEHSQS